MRHAKVLIVFLALLVSSAVLGANINAELFVAVKKGDLASVQALLSKGADVNARDKDGKTPLIASSWVSNNFDIAKLLADKGADVNARDKNGNTALMGPAWIKGNIDIVRLLLDRGADANARNADGITTLMIAAGMGFNDMVKLLLAKGADINIKSANGATAVSLAQSRGHDEIVQLLRQSGATGIKETEIPVGELKNLPQKHRQAVVAVYEAWVAGRLSDSAQDFLKVVAGGKPSLSPPLSLGDIPAEVLQVVLNGKVRAFTDFLEPWAENIARNSAAYRLSSDEWQGSKEGVEWSERMRRSRVAFRATLERAVLLSKISRLTADSIVEQSGLPLRDQYAQARADESARKAADPYFQRGYSYSRKGQYDWAIADLTKAIELDPKFAEAYGLRGAAYLGQGQYDQAITDANKAIELVPKSAEAYGLRGEIYLRKGQYDQAIADLTKAIELSHPNLAGVYYLRGFAYVNKGQYAQASSDANKALELNPKYPDPHFLKAIVYEKMNLKTEAIEAYRDFIKRASPQDTARIEMAKKRITLLERIIKLEKP